MFCPQCGVSNSDESKYCTSCGSRLEANTQPSSASVAPPVAPTNAPIETDAAPSSQPNQPSNVRPHVDNHLVWAILVTLFCCLPFGIVSIVYAAQVDSKLAAGDYDGARNSANTAKNWAWAAFACGLAVIILYAIFWGVTAATLSRTRF